MMARTQQPEAQLAAMLDRLCPMYLMLDATGHIRRAGPTLRKLRPHSRFEGRRFMELFELQRPRSVTNMSDLMATPGARLHLQFRDAPHTALKGLIVPSGDGAGAVVNLSFGISILDAVRDYDLNGSDFPATDLAIELLYLVEAKSAAMEASRTLNQRLQGAMIAAEEQAFTDTLTGLKNRRAMDHVLDRLIATGTPFSLMHLDLDFFKAVNDTLGHAAGDHVLQQVARAMVDLTRDRDTVVRIGGDEFVLIFDTLQDKSRLDSIAQRLISRLEEPIPFDGQPCRVSASIGTVLSRDLDAPDGASLLQAADVALYEAKRAGRACHRFYVPPCRAQAAEREPRRDVDDRKGIPAAPAATPPDAGAPGGDPSGAGTKAALTPAAELAGVELPGEGSVIDRPDAGRPDIDRPDAGRLDADGPNADRPDTTRPDTTRPDTSRPDTSRPGPDRSGGGMG